MGSGIELNDTLQLNAEQGFPVKILNRAGHLKNPVKPADLASTIFEFHNKDGARVFHLDPVRVYLVENLNGKWLFWGKALIQSQTMNKKLNADGSWDQGNWVTSGTYRISEVYDPEYQELFTRRESPAGKSYFD